MASCTSSIRLAHEYDKIKINHNLVVNRVRNKRYEISVGEIEEYLRKKGVRSYRRKDYIVPISVSEHIPAFILDTESKFSGSIMKISRKYAAVSDSWTQKNSKSSGGILQFLRRLFRFR